MREFYEFFAGGGMARAGLGQGWACRFANDFDHKKGASYQENWGGEELTVGDVRDVQTADLPGQVDLAWASFPCQDLSLAGGGAGLKGERSGTFWPFWSLITGLNAEERAPRLIVLENVSATLTSHGGSDFVAIATALVEQGHRCGALVVDAALFVPQSRPRLFVIAVKDGVEIPADLTVTGPESRFHTRQLVAAYDKMSPEVAERWLWWHLPIPPKRKKNFADLIEGPSDATAWRSEEETKALLDMISPVNRAKVESVRETGKRVVGCVYKRTRPTAAAGKVQRAEIRFDNVSGCLRTPAGGSSRQLIVVVEGKQVRSRLITARETARLMGLPDRYKLPKNYNDAYHLTGDGVAIPVVRHLAANVLEPILAANQIDIEPETNDLAEELV